VKPKGEEESLEEWVSNRFGKRLYQLFFKSYTEKVWGVPCSEVRAEWAAQRIKGLSFFSAAKAAFFGNKGNKVKSLISEFHYPRFGPGQMWDTMTREIRGLGGQVLTETEVERLNIENGRIVSVEAGGETIVPSQVISSLPLRATVEITRPLAPPEVREAARGLRYRDFLTVALVIDGEDLFPDNWIYIHEPGVKVGRIQNFKNWSPAMVPDPSKTCLGMEYFVFENDELWTSPDDKLIQMARNEIAQLGLVRPEEIEDGTVVRMRKAYPMYDPGWTERIETIREYARASLKNLQFVGRNGMHKYNNQDHSMMTALCAAQNICGAGHDIWAINSEPDYHEEMKESESRPKRAHVESVAM
jgi:protoporphyrinogen oxidase